MGADLYIMPLHQQQRQQWEPQFEAAVRRRDSLKRGSKEYQQAQEEVEECYEKLHEEGYFRDPYNDWDLLWKFGLSWWDDVIPMLDKEGCLSVAQVRSLLAMLKERENVFALKLAEFPAEEQRHFRSRYTDLQKFLNQAIELNTPIEASL
jgi:chaperonin cofactor prefoldin